NDHDVDGDPLAAVLVSRTTHGSLSLDPNGGFTYTPAVNYNGADAFIYKACDGSLRSVPLSEDLRVGPVNDAPVATAESYTTAEDTSLTVAAPGVLANDHDVDGDPLTAVLVTGPGHGTVTLNPDGSFTYTPALNFNGVDAFYYKAFDGSLGSVM